MNQKMTPAELFNNTLDCRCHRLLLIVLMYL